MNRAVRRAVVFALPILVLPVAAQAAPKVGTVTSSNGALVARDGKVVPAVTNMSLFQGDKVMTRANGSANVSIGSKSVNLGGSSMLPMNGKSGVLTMNGNNAQGSGFGGGDFRRDFLRQLAAFKRFVRDLRCRHPGFPHVTQAGFGGNFDFDADWHKNDRGKGHHHHGNGNGNGHDPGHHCPPVSP